MSKRKYEMIKRDSITIDGHKLYRIRALCDIPCYGIHKGDLGGYIESEKNLSHRGDAWVGDNACIYADAMVTGGARVYGAARVSGRGRIVDNAQVYDDAWVYDAARVAGNAHVYGTACISGRVCITGNGCVSSDA